MKQKDKTGSCSLEYDELLEFYEKHYFHEVDMREKLLARVQISLAMFVSVCSLLSYMLSNIKTFDWMSIECRVFAGAMVLCFIFLMAAFVFFLKSFFNYTYQFLPTAKKTEEYRLKLIETYQPYEERDELVKKYFKQYLFNLYIQCTTINSENNELRSAHFHNTNKMLIPAFLFVLIALMFFYFGKINQDEPKEVKVSVTSPIEIMREDYHAGRQSSGQATNNSRAATATGAATSKADKGRR